MSEEDNAPDNPFASQMRVPIPTLDPASQLDETKHVEGIITLVWPYSSTTQSSAILVAAPDMRLRRRKGQVRICLRAPVAREFASAQIGIGDKVWLALRGASWLSQPAQEPVATPGRSVDGELLYQHHLFMKAQRNEDTPTLLNVNVDPTLHEPHSSSQIDSSSQVVAAQTSARKSDLLTQSWSSPFIKRSSPLDALPVYDPFLDDGDLIDTRGGKRSKFGRKSSEWRYVAQSPPQSPTRNGVPHAEGPESTELERPPDSIASVHSVTQQPLSPAATPQGPFIEVDEAPIAPLIEQGSNAPSKPSLSIPNVLSSAISSGAYPQTPTHVRQLSANIPPTPASPHLQPVASPGLPLVSPLAFPRPPPSFDNTQSFEQASASAAPAFNLRASQPSMVPMSEFVDSSVASPYSGFEESSQNNSEQAHAITRPINDSMQPPSSVSPLDEDNLKPSLQALQPQQASDNVNEPASASLRDHTTSRLEIDQESSAASKSISMPTKTSKGLAAVSPLDQAPQARRQGTVLDQSSMADADINSPVVIDIDDPVFEFFGTGIAADIRMGAASVGSQDHAKSEDTLSLMDTSAEQENAESLDKAQQNEGKDATNKQADPGIPLVAVYRTSDESRKSKELPVSTESDAIRLEVSQGPQFSRSRVTAPVGSEIMQNVDTLRQDRATMNGSSHVSSVGEVAQQPMKLLLADEEMNELAPLPLSSQFAKQHPAKDGYQSFTSVSESSHPHGDVASSPLPHAQPKSPELEPTDTEEDIGQGQRSQIAESENLVALDDKATNTTLDPLRTKSGRDSAPLDEKLTSVVEVAMEKKLPDADSKSSARPVSITAAPSTPRHRVDQILDGINADFTPTAATNAQLKPQLVHLEPDMNIEPNQQATTKPQEPPKSSPPETRKSSRLRMGKVPDVLSPWFSSKKSNRTKMTGKSNENEQTPTQPKTSLKSHAMPTVSLDVKVDPGKRDRRVTIVEPQEPPQTPQSAKEKTRGFRTSLAYYAPLSSADVYVNASSSQGDSASVDFFGIVTSKSSTPAKAKAGPRDHYTVLHVSDPSAWPKTIQTECFRPYKKSLPEADIGDVILLRNFVVQSRDRDCFLLSAGSSAWCVWRYGANADEATVDGAAREECKGPPVELGQEERGHAAELRAWWLEVKDQPTPKSTPKSTRKDRKRKSGRL